MTSRRVATVARAAAAALLATAGGSFVGATAAAQAEACSSYGVYSALGSAMGIRSVDDAPGVTLFSTVDANVPGAQAQLDSIDGSIGWAGAPYSETVSGNIGVVGGAATPNDVPVFAVSTFPAEPHQVERSIGAGTLRATSDASSSTASATIGAAVGDTGLGYGMTTEASAACGDDGTLFAEAEAVVSALDVGGVLRIGSVRSYARIVYGPDGVRDIEGTVAVEGISVFGQAVGFSDQGLEFGPTVVPLGENPLAAALAGEGITVRVLEATSNVQEGFAIAPALEITVAHEIDGLGSGPMTTRYLVGQAFVRAGLTSVAVAPRPATTTPTPAAAIVPPSPTVASGVASAPLPTPPAVPGAPSAAHAAPAGAASFSGELISWSILPAFSALAAGGLLFLLSWFALGRVQVRYRWS